MSSLPRQTSVIRPAVRVANISFKTTGLSPRPSAHVRYMPKAISRPPPNLAQANSDNHNAFKDLEKQVSQLSGIKTPTIIAAASDITFCSVDMIDILNTVYKTISTTNVLMFGSPTEIVDLVTQIFQYSMINRIKIPPAYISGDTLLPMALSDTSQILLFHQILNTIFEKVPSKLIVSAITEHQVPVLVDQYLLPDSKVRNSVYQLCTNMLAIIPQYKNAFIKATVARLDEAILNKTNSYSCHSLIRLLLFLIRGLKPHSLFHLTILPLFTHPFLGDFIDSLQAIAFYFAEDSDKFYDELVSFLLLHWPVSSSIKVTLFIQTIINAIQIRVPSAEHLERFTFYLIDSINSTESVSVMLTSLDVLQDEDLMSYLVSSIYIYSELFNQAIEKSAQHWNETVVEYARNVQDFYQKVNQFPVDGQNLGIKTDIWKIITQAAQMNGYENVCVQ